MVDEKKKEELQKLQSAKSNFILSKARVMAQFPNFAEVKEFGVHFSESVNCESSWSQC